MGNNTVRNIRTIIAIIVAAGLIWGIYFLVNEYGKGTKNSTATSGNVMQDSQTEKIPEVDKYKIDLSYAEVNIYSTTKNPYIVTKDTEHYIYSCSEDTQRGIVTIKIEPQGGVAGKIISSLDFEPCEVDLYLPKKKLDNVDFIFSACEADVAEIEAENAFVSVSAGDAKVKKGCDFDNIITQVNAGNLDFYVDDDVKTIDAEVSAGDTTIYLPDDIDGFTCNYDVALGDFDDRFTHNDIKNNLSEGGKITYGDNSVDIKVDVAAGNITLDRY